jgi:filamentous hemagglutinin family protein
MKSGCWNAWLVVAGCVEILFFSHRAIAQLNLTPDTAPDRALGTIVVPFNAQIDLITGGTRPGNGINLFHSFQEFNVRSGRAVYFANPAGVENILSRVTGGNPSNILGRLGVQGTANLFLINPNGIIFERTATLDVGGAFVATTANAIQFGNQGIFSATNPDAPPLLTVNPSALLFNQINSGGIVNRARSAPTDPVTNPRFSLQPGSLFVVGGNVTFDNGIASTVGNRLELGGLAGVGSVGLLGSGNGLQLSFPEGVPRADVVLQNSAFALTTRGGAFAVHARNLTLSGQSIIGTTLQVGEGTAGRRSADVVIDTTGITTLDQSFIDNLGLNNSLGDTGDIAINAQAIRLVNGSQINTSGQKSRGSIRLRVSDDITLNNSLITTFGNQSSSGISGDIVITARTINLSNQSALNSGNIGQGQGGKTTLKAQDTVLLSSGSGIFTSSGASIFGGVNRDSSGDIEIRARSLALDGKNTTISSTNFDQGRGGNIQITTDDSILLNGYINVSSSTNGSGNGGDIQLQTRSLTLLNGGTIGTQTKGRGSSGSLVVNATDSVSLSGTATVTNVDGSSFIIGSDLSTGAIGTGDGGQLFINTGRLTIRDGGGVSTGTTLGQSGRGGDLTVNASQSVEVIGRIPDDRYGSSITTATLGSGDAGNLTITTPYFSIREGGFVNAGVNSNSSGNGGNVILNVPGTLEVVGISPSGQTYSSLFAGTSGSGNSGAITINATRLSIREGGFVGTEARQESSGRGGDLTVNASESVEVIGTNLNGQLPSALSASTAGKGNAGNLTLNTQRLSVLDGGIVSTTTYSANRAQGGNLRINVSDLVEIAGNPSNGTFSGLTAITFGAGDAGDLSIATRRLSLRNNSVVSTSTSSSGQGGNLDVRASDSVEILANPANKDFADGLFTTTSGSGAAGNLTIYTQRLNVRNGGAISAATALGSTGQGGNVTIDVPDSIDVVGASDDGSLRSTLSVRTRGTGAAGNLTVNTPRLSLRDRASISAESNAVDGGNIILNVDRLLLLRENSNISTTAGLATGTGNGGNITINMPNGFLVAVPQENSDITANAFQGSGGNIRITARGIFGTQFRPQLTPESDITASSTFGVSGTVAIASPDTSTLQNALTQLPKNPIDTNALLSNSCIVRRTQQSSSFTITGSGGLPVRPDDVSVSAYPTGEVQSVDLAREREKGNGEAETFDTQNSELKTQNATNPRPWKIGDPIVEPTGVYQLETGQLVMSRECENYTR